MPTIRWIHLSDIHIRASREGLERYNSNVILNALWNDINNRALIAPELDRIDLAFITGDIVWSGGAGPTGDEYDEAYSRLIEPLAKNTGLRIEDVYIVPGNHDVCRESIDEEAVAIKRRLTKRDRVSELFVESRYNADRIKLLSRLGAYGKFVSSRLKHIKLDDNYTFYQQHKTRYSGINVQIIGFNSAIVAQGGKPDKLNLIIGEPNVSRAFGAFSTREPRIVLAHHPFSDVAGWYRDSEKHTLTLVQSSADVLLSGHVHEPNVLSQSSLSGSTIQIIAGSIYDNREWASNSYSYVCFDPQKGEGRIYLRRYKDTGPNGPEWMRDLESTGDIANGISTIKLMRAEDAYIRLQPSKGQSEEFKNLVDVQTQDLDRRPLLSTTYPDRDAIGILFPDIYVDPLVHQRKHPSPAPVPLKDWFASNKGHEKRVLLLGNPGTGKTTSLIQLHHQIADKSTSEDSQPLPLFIEARSHDWSSPMRLRAIIDIITRTHDLKRDNYTQIAEGEIDTFVMIDALDEAFPSAYQDFGSIDSAILNMGFPHIASCRVDFFERNLSDADFCGDYDEILVLENWKLDREVKQFLDNYLEHVLKLPKGGGDAQDIQRYLGSLCEAGLPITPLSVTTFLFLWRYERSAIASNPITSFASLLDRFIRSWARRELTRHKSLFNTPEDLLYAYETVSWELYLNRDNGHPTLSKIVEAIVRHRKDYHADAIMVDRALLSMLRLEKDKFYNQLLVVAFIHESIYEFMLATKLVRALRFEDDMEALSYLYGHSVHQLAREILAQLPLSEKSILIDTLKRKFYALIGLQVDQAHGKLKQIVTSILGFLFKASKNTSPLKESNGCITQRGNICYFWGRLEAETKGGLLKELYLDIVSGKVIEHPMNIGTIGTGILLTNDPRVESMYLASISNGGREDIRNRTYHRVYYGDAIYKDPDTFLSDDYINGTDDWPKTRQAILRRFESVDPRSQALRGLDIVTFRRLCETRGIPNLELMQIQILKESVKKLDHLPKRKVEIIVAEHNKLLQLLNI